MRRIAILSFLLTPLTALADERPNILWISCEDISPHLGCYGDPQATTPNLDQFASQGVRFTQAHHVHGVCAPARTGIITGMYPTSLGCNHMRCKGRLPEHVKPFPHYLKQEAITARTTPRPTTTSNGRNPRSGTKPPTKHTGATGRTKTRRSSPSSTSPCVTSRVSGPTTMPNGPRTCRKSCFTIRPR